MNLFMQMDIILTSSQFAVTCFQRTFPPFIGKKPGYRWGMSFTGKFCTIIGLWFMFNMQNFFSYLEGFPSSGREWVAIYIGGCPSFGKELDIN